MALTRLVQSNKMQHQFVVGVRVELCGDAGMRRCQINIAIYITIASLTGSMDYYLLLLVCLI